MLSVDNWWIVFWLFAGPILFVAWCALMLALFAFAHKAWDYFTSV